MTTNAYSLFRSLIIYSICLPLAIYLGYLMANPLDIVTFVSIALVLALFMVPILLRWHYPWLILCWNTTAGLYFLPGKPTLAMVMMIISFVISLLSYIMNRELKFISVPSVTWPLLYLTGVVLATAKLTGGIGLGAMGSSNMGGKRYLVLLVSLMGFFAITAHRILPKKGKSYINLYFFGGLSGVVGQLASVVTPSFYFIFLVFPAVLPGANSDALGAETVTRMSGLAMTSTSVLAWLLARHGLSGLLKTRKYHLTLLFVGCVVCTSLGGFRSMIIALGMTCFLLFWMEGLFKSRLLPAVLLTGMLMVTIVISFANKMPLSMQRSLSFLPLNLDTAAVLSAKDSTDWRLQMWQDVLPTVPKYLILGKGYGIDTSDFDMLSRGLNAGEIGAAGSELAGDYHNGPLSLIIPFGIFGVIGFLWFLAAGWRVLYRNYRYGDPDYQVVSRYLLVDYSVRIFMFFTVFGSFYSDMAFFLGPIGLSIALHGGVRGPVMEPVKRPVVNKFKFAGAARQLPAG